MSEVYVWIENLIMNKLFHSLPAINSLIKIFSIQKYLAFISNPLPGRLHKFSRPKTLMSGLFNYATTATTYTPIPCVYTPIWNQPPLDIALSHLLCNS